LGRYSPGRTEAARDRGARVAIRQRLRKGGGHLAAGEERMVSEELDERQAQRRVLQAMRAVLSDDHNYERGLATLNDLVDRIVRENGSTGLRDVAVALSVALATALERIAQDQGLAAEDMVEVWFAE
jgi:hypothetical protein